MAIQCDELVSLWPAAPDAMAKIAIAIPAYNEGRHLAEVIARCRALRPALICVVDDCSTDDTAAVLRAEMRRDGARLIVIRNAKNLGKQGSVRRALNRLIVEPVDAVALIDGDMQHDPDELPALAAVLASHDVVIGARSKAEMPWQRRLSNWFVNRTFAAIAGVDFIDVQSGLRLYRKPLADALAHRLSEGGGFGVEHECLRLLADLAHRGTGLRVAAAPITCRYRDEVSHIGARDVLRLIKDTFVKAYHLRRGLRAPRALRAAPTALPSGMPHALGTTSPG
jgi:glycosyltransferase involved in cell wall biosynthesis